MANETNSINWPTSYDTTLNWPSVTVVTEATGAEINRNRDALFLMERVLGLNPHIGIYTTDTVNATVNERLEIIENGLADGNFAWEKINVDNALIIDTSVLNQTYVYIGRAQTSSYTAAEVTVKGPLRVEDSGVGSTNYSLFRVPVRIEKTQASGQSAAVQITGTSSTTDPLLYIKDYYSNSQSTDRLALKVEGNAYFTGSIFGSFSISHSELSNIDTIPRSGQAQSSVRHVARGDYHSHKKDWNSYSSTTGSYSVDSNPSDATYGIIDHHDLDNVFTKRGNTNFRPVDGVAYHVTDGDDHDHTGGRGAQISHSSIIDIDPTVSNHVTNGDKHNHTLNGGGALLSHDDLLEVGVMSHWAIDKKLTTDWNELQAQVNEVESKNTALETSINDLTSIIAASTAGDSQFENDRTYKVAGGRKALSTSSGTTIIDSGLDSIMTYSVNLENEWDDGYGGGDIIKNVSVGTGIDIGNDGIAITVTHYSLTGITYIRWFAFGI